MSSTTVILPLEDLNLAYHPTKIKSVKINHFTLGATKSFNSASLINEIIKSCENTRDSLAAFSEPISELRADRRRASGKSRQEKRAEINEPPRTHPTTIIMPAEATVAAVVIRSSRHRRMGERGVAV